MKKKGFTLVELLAVIAILAILVIVAMPNVLGMFSNAKVNTFVTEVQKYMDTAKTSFVQQAVTLQAQQIIFTSETACKVAGCTTKDNLGHGKLDMDGNKEYYISLDRHGNFTRVAVWDPSLCYDSKELTGDASKQFEKTTVVNTEVYNSGTTDGVADLNPTWDATNSIWKIGSTEVKSYANSFCTGDKAIQ